MSTFPSSSPGRRSHSAASPEREPYPLRPSLLPASPPPPSAEASCPPSHRCTSDKPRSIPLALPRSSATETAIAKEALAEASRPDISQACRARQRAPLAHTALVQDPARQARNQPDSCARREERGGPGSSHRRSGPPLVHVKESRIAARDGTAVWVPDPILEGRFANYRVSLGRGSRGPSNRPHRTRLRIRPHSPSARGPTPPLRLQFGDFSSGGRNLAKLVGSEIVAVRSSRQRLGCTSNPNARHRPNPPRCANPRAGRRGRG